MDKIEKLVAPYCDNHNGCGGASYDEVINKINEIIDALNGKEDPELAESEDERVRKGLIKLLTVASEAYLVESTGIKKDSYLAWLEKQKEPARKFTVQELLDEYDKGYEHGKLEGVTVGYNKAMKEQKPVMGNGISEQTKMDETVYKFTPEEWMKALDEQLPKEPKPAGWSEEDEDMLNSCISSIEEAKENRYAYKETDGDTSYDHEIAWLKSLRPSWKPSEEQMNALNFAITYMFSTKANPTVLRDLYNDLLKLVKE